MRKFSCEHIHVNSKSFAEERLFTVNTHYSLCVVQTNVLRHDFVCGKLLTEKGW